MIHANLQAAIRAQNLHIVELCDQVKNLIACGWSLNKATKQVGISKPRYKRWLQKKAAGSTANVRRGAPTVLSETEENAVVESLLMLSRRGVGLTVKMLKQKVAMI